MFRVEAGELSPPAAKRLRNELDRHLSGLAGEHVGRIDEDRFGAIFEDSCRDETCTDPLSTHLCKLSGGTVPPFVCAPNTKSETLTDGAIDAIVKVCKPSGYGDLATATTKVDPAVRHSVETTEHPLIDSTLAKHRSGIRDLASNLFVVGWHDVEVVPKKLIVYREGGHFAKHVDTPPAEPHHLGTAVVEIPCACNTSWCSSGGELWLHCDDGPSRRLRGVSVFKPNIPHEVTEVAAGARVSVTFEIFKKVAAPPPTAADDDLSADEVVLVRALKHVYNEYGEDVGFILNNRYSLDQALHGEADTRLAKVIAAAGMTAVRYPVVIDYECTSDCDGGNRKESAHVCAVKGFEGPTPRAVHFYVVGDGAGEVLRREEEEGAYYTGNESRDSSLKMRYYATALVAVGPDDDDDDVDPAAAAAAAEAETAADPTVAAAAVAETTTGNKRPAETRADARADATQTAAPRAETAADPTVAAAAVAETRADVQPPATSE